ELKKGAYIQNDNGRLTALRKLPVSYKCAIRNDIFTYLY
ncbi:helix-turn-helix domain-containing protein, partial [Salmonella enterica subsp. enterica serovar Weltevreden]|nr:helix-turn-helix domain-containing protein [Salmonella enterica subsp. enterica serovar Weltevreden]